MPPPPRQVARPLPAIIRALRDTVEPGPRLSACGPTGVAGAPALDLAGLTGEPFPNGSYRATLTREDLEAAGASAGFAGSNWGTKTWTFTDGSARLDQGEHGGSPCAGIATATGDLVEVTRSDGGCGIDAQYVWRAVDGGIEMAVVPPPNQADRDYIDYRAFIHRIWTKVD